MPYYSATTIRDSFQDDSMSVFWDITFNFTGDIEAKF